MQETQETVLCIHADGEKHKVFVTDSKIGELARRLLDRSVVGLIFLDRLDEVGDPPNKDKGGERE